MTTDWGGVRGVSSEGLYDDRPVVSTESCPLSLTIQGRTSVERGSDTQKWIWPPLNCPPLTLQGVTNLTRLSLLMSRCWGTSPMCVCACVMEWALVKYWLGFYRARTSFSVRLLPRGSSPLARESLRIEFILSLALWQDRFCGPVVLRATPCVESGSGSVVAGWSGGCKPTENLSTQAAWPRFNIVKPRQSEQSGAQSQWNKKI